MHWTFVVYYFIENNSDKIKLDINLKKSRRSLIIAIYAFHRNLRLGNVAPQSLERWVGLPGNNYNSLCYPEATFYIDIEID